MVVGLGLGLGSVVGLGRLPLRVRQWLWSRWLWSRSKWLWSVWRGQPIQSCRITAPAATRWLLPRIDRRSLGATNPERNPGIRTEPRRRELSWILPAELD